MSEPRFDFRPVAEADLPLLFERLSRPHLVGWSYVAMEQGGGC